MRTITVRIPDEPGAVKGQTLIVRQHDPEDWTLHQQSIFGASDEAYGLPVEVLQDLIERLQSYLNYWQAKDGAAAEVKSLEEALEESIQLKKGYECND